MDRDTLRCLLCFTFVAAFTPAAGLAGGFRFDDQGTKAAGLGSAFTAQASDPSAVFYNPGGVALLGKGGLLVGTSIVEVNESLFQGLSPGVAAGTNGEQDVSTKYLVHAYLVKPLNPIVVLGVGLNQPFHLDTSWASPDTFAGREVATAAELLTYDLTPVLSLQLTPKLGFGVGGVVRSSELSAERRLRRFNPLTLETVDVATVAVATDMENAYGWTAGILHRPSPKFSWGLTYRSSIEVDYGAAGRLTQILTGSTQFDQLVRATLPFDTDLPVLSALEFPATASFGVALGLGQAITFEVDADWTEWSTVPALPFTFTTEPGLSQTLELTFDDAMTYRAGLLVRQASGSELRLGYAFHEAAQPASTLGPFFADAERHTLSLGWGKDWLGIAASYTDEAERETRLNPDGINGAYSGNRFSVTLSVKLGE